MSKFPSNGSVFDLILQQKPWYAGQAWQNMSVIHRTRLNHWGCLAAWADFHSWTKWQVWERKRKIGTCDKLVVESVVPPPSLLIMIKLQEHLEDVVMLTGISDLGCPSEGPRSFRGLQVKTMEIFPWKHFQQNTYYILINSFLNINLMILGRDTAVRAAWLVHRETPLPDSCARWFLVCLHRFWRRWTDEIPVKFPQPSKWNPVLSSSAPACSGNSSWLLLCHLRPFPVIQSIPSISMFTLLCSALVSIQYVQN